VTAPWWKSGASRCQSTTRERPAARSSERFEPLGSSGEGLRAGRLHRVSTFCIVRRLRCAKGRDASTAPVGVVCPRESPAGSEPRGVACYREPSARWRTAASPSGWLDLSVFVFLDIDVFSRESSTWLFACFLGDATLSYRVCWVSVEAYPP
jgi:hypothetical protein